VSDGKEEDIGIGRNKDSLPYFTQNLLRICGKEEEEKGKILEWLL